MGVPELWSKELCIMFLWCFSSEGTSEEVQIPFLEVKLVRCCSWRAKSWPWQHGQDIFMSTYPLERWRESTDPIEHRCQASAGADGVCRNKVIFDEEGNPISTMCPMHGGSQSVNRKIKEEANRYRVQLWQQHLDEQSNNPNVKSLRDEISVLRMMLKQFLDRSNTQTELLINSGRIADLIVKIEKLVVSCDRLEARSGALMDKSAALSFAGKIVEILSNNLSPLEEKLGPTLLGSVIDSINEQIISILGEL
jgi:hypothetical protein